MNENQNSNLGNANGVTAPGQTPTPVAPNANPNIVAPAVTNPTIAPTQVNPAPAPVEGPSVAPTPAPTPMGNPVAPNTNPSLPGMTPMGANPVNTVTPADTNITAPVQAPVEAPAANPSLPGMAPANPTPMGNTPNPNVAPGITPAPSQGTITLDPNALGTTAPTPNGGQAPQEEDTKKFDTKTIILVAVAILAVIFAVVYFLFLNPNKKKPAPAPVNNTTENVTNNTTGNTTDNTTDNTTNNTTNDPEPEEIDEYDMSWMGSYTADDMSVSIYYSAPKVIELEVTKSGSSGASSAQLSLDVDSLKKITYEDDYLGEKLKLELTKTSDGISLKTETEDKESVFNDLDQEFKKEEIKSKGWSGFYKTEGGQIIINEVLENGGVIDLSAESSKYSNLQTTYDLKDDKITIKAKSFTKDDTVIIKDGDNLVVTSDEYLKGTYEKLS